MSGEGSRRLRLGVWDYDPICLSDTIAQAESGEGSLYSFAGTLPSYAWMPLRCLLSS
jgi:hypothetical protein